MEQNKEFAYKGFVMNGFLAFFLLIALFVVSIYLFTLAEQTPWFATVGGILLFIACLCCNGFIKLEPNEAKALVFFGKYRGTFTSTGFHWVNPLMSKKGVSLRARNLNPEPIKVNDKAGNPVMIGMVLVWKLENTYKALFEIDSQSLAGPSPKGGVSTRQLSSAFAMRAREEAMIWNSEASEIARMPIAIMTSMSVKLFTLGIRLRRIIIPPALSRAR
jgi:regulator of protease activity HflC (stomatin/prohibitin superfamily)